MSLRSFLHHAWTTPSMGRVRGGARGFGQAMRQSWMPLTLVTIAVGLVHTSGLLRSADLPMVDASLSLMSPVPAAAVRVVAISELDFQKVWGNARRRPDVLKIWIEKICKSRPLVVGVDLTTSAPEFAPLAELADRLNCRIVWARSADIDDAKNLVRPHSAVGGGIIRAMTSTGIALGHQDEDGTLRELPRFLDTAAGPRPSFHWSVVRAACDAGLPAPVCWSRRYRTEFSSDERLIHPFRRRLELRPVSVAHLLEMTAQGTVSAFRDRIVLLGGTFPEARDGHQTPLGELVGVEILAHGIEGELEGRGIARVGKVALTLMEIGIALLLLASHHFIGGKPAFVLNVLVAPVLMIVASFVVFRVLGLFLTFAPVVLGMLAHQLYEDYQRA